MTFSVVMVLGILFLSFDASLSQNVYEHKYLVPGKIYYATLNGKQKLCIYCYKGIQKSLLHIWQTAYLLVNLNKSDYNLYKGSSAQDVFEMYEGHKSSWTNQLMSWKSDKIDLDPFNVNCVGIDTSVDHRMVINIIRIDLWRVVCLASGIFTFLAAPKLSSNPIFYYICGVTLGISTSFLFLLYLISKLIPKKPTMYGLMIGGWAIGVYLFQLLLENLIIITTVYHTYILMYMCVTGIISFMVCYRFGPVTDPRSKNLIKWAMQAASLALVFYSSRCQEASTLIILLLLFYYNFPKEWCLSLLSLWLLQRINQYKPLFKIKLKARNPLQWSFKPWRRTFPKKARLLTEDEYHEEGARETMKALEDLRKYCSSPECNQWKTILSLQKPLRFAQFMEGSPHLEDSEILAYESEAQKSMALMTDDSDTSEED